MKFMKKVLVMLLITMMMINVIPVHAVTYNEYKKGDKIKVKVNDKDTFEFYVLEDSGSSSDTVKAIYSDVLSGTFNYENATKKVTSLKDTWKNVSSIALPKMEDIFGSSVNLTKFFEYTTQTWALSNLRYWTSNKTKWAKGNTTLKKQILADNDEQADASIDFSKVSSDTNGKGLYYTSTNTINNAKTYYFRGDVDNNYVIFGKNSSGQDLYWRIMRINEDGSIRLIYSGIGETTTKNGKVIDKNSSLPDSITFSESGYMYGIGSDPDDITSNTYDSEIKKYLDKWYTNNLENNYGEYISNVAGFCDDRGPTIYGVCFDENGAGVDCYVSCTDIGITDSYEEYCPNPDVVSSDTPMNPGDEQKFIKYRVENFQPKYMCLYEARDLFTPTYSSMGNLKLTKLIGLPTADDLMYAGAVYGKTNDSFYLYSESDFWAMQRYKISDFGGTSGTSSSVYARPVINLVETIEVIGGNGTHDEPYILATVEEGTELGWSLGGSTEGIAQRNELTTELSVKPVITISKQYIDSGSTTPDDGDTDGEDGDGDGTTPPGDDGDDDNGDGTTTPDDGNTDGDDGKGDGSTIPDDEPENPSTGDNILVLICSTLILGATAVYAYRRKINN